MVRRLRRLAVPLACLALLALTTQAKASFSLTLSQIGGTPPASLTLGDGGSGSIFYAGSFGAFSFEAVTATSNYPGDSTSAMLQTIDITTTNKTSGSVSLLLAVNSDGSAAFTMPGGNGSHMVVYSSLASSLAQGSATYTSTIDSTSVPTVSLSGPGYVAKSLDYFRGQSFSLGGNLLITLGSGQTAQFTATTEAVAMPAPGGMMLLLIGLPMIGLGGRWFGRRRPAVTMAA